MVRVGVGSWFQLVRLSIASWSNGLSKYLELAGELVTVGYSWFL